MKETRQIPVQKGKNYDISIVRLGSSGEGVGRYEGFTVFVPFALPGETVRARITLVKKTYATASLVEVLKPSGPDPAPVSRLRPLRRLPAPAPEL